MTATQEVKWNPAVRFNDFNKIFHVAIWHIGCTKYQLVLLLPWSASIAGNIFTELNREVDIFLKTEVVRVAATNSSGEVLYSFKSGICREVRVSCARPYFQCLCKF